MTIHDFDLARFMLGEEPIEVFALANALIDPAFGKELNEVDSAMFVLRTASGKQCHINNSRTAVYGYDQRVELMGTKGMLLLDNRKPHELRRYTATSTETSRRPCAVCVKTTRILPPRSCCKPRMCGLLRALRRSVWTSAGARSSPLQVRSAAARKTLP